MAEKYLTQIPLFKLLLSASSCFAAFMDLAVFYEVIVPLLEVDSTGKLQVNRWMSRI